jgi:tryptophan synthase beta subunit
MIESRYGEYGNYVPEMLVPAPQDVAAGYEKYRLQASWRSWTTT